MPDGIVSHRRGHANTTMAPQSCELHIGRNGEELLFARLQQPTLMNDVETKFDGKTLVARIPMRFQRRGGRKHIVAPDGSEIIPTGNPQPDGTLVKALARAGAGRSCPVSTSTRQSPRRPGRSPRSIATITCSGDVERVADAWDHAAIAPRRFAIQPRR